jgi:hypothetical protein
MGRIDVSPASAPRRRCRIHRDVEASVDTGGRRPLRIAFLAGDHTDDASPPLIACPRRSWILGGVPRANADPPGPGAAKSGRCGAPCKRGRPRGTDPPSTPGTDRPSTPGTDRSAMRGTARRPVPGSTAAFSRRDGSPATGSPVAGDAGRFGSAAGGHRPAASQAGAEARSSAESLTGDEGTSLAGTPQSSLGNGRCTRHVSLSRS